jgi:hypothetical protein
MPRCARLWGRALSTRSLNVYHVHNPGCGRAALRLCSLPCRSQRGSASSMLVHCNAVTLHIGAVLLMQTGDRSGSVCRFDTLSRRPMAVGLGAARRGRVWAQEEEVCRALY